MITPMQFKQRIYAARRKRIERDASQKMNNEFERHVYQNAGYSISPDPYKALWAEVQKLREQRETGIKQTFNMLGGRN